MTSPASRRIHKHEWAKRDLVEIYAYLSVRSERTARRFLQEAKQAFELILETPGIGQHWESPVPALQDLRVTTVSRRFHNYLIFYRVVKDGVQIVTVVHGARDLPAILESLPMDNPDDLI